MAATEPQEEKTPVSRNVYLTILLLFIWGLADSIWTGTILAAWLFNLAGGEKGKDPNTEVGFVEAASGLAGVITALPIGYLADKYGRSPLCKVGGVGFLFSTALTAYVVLAPMDSNHQLVLLTLAMVCWGTFGGILNGPAQALFADSIPKGSRSYWYSLLMFAYTIPSVAGPGIAIALFEVYGDDWTFEQMKPVFLAGLILEIPPGLLIFGLRDDLALPESEEDDNPNGDGEACEAQISQLESESFSYRMVKSLGLTKASIPYILFCSDLLVALGSGMTVKFFPLFFKNEIELSPSGVQGIYMAVPIVMMGFTIGAQKLSLVFGRVQVVICTRIVGISLLVALAVLVDRSVVSWHIIVPIYIIRTGIMNCTYPLDESILMDNVPKNTRSRWKSLESISAFGWCGSALFGGMLADDFSYNFSFLITAAMQFGGALLYILLIPLVEDEKPSEQGNNTSSELEEPLLAAEENNVEAM